MGKSKDNTTDFRVVASPPPYMVFHLEERLPSLVSSTNLAI